MRLCSTALRFPCACKVVFVFFLVLACSSSIVAWYAEPPHAEVAGHNDALGPSLLGRRIPAGGSPPRSSPLRFFSIDVRAVYPSVDGKVSAAHPPKAVWGWSYDAQPDYDWEGSLSGCGSNRSHMRFEGASGTFRGVWALPGLSRTRSNPASPMVSDFSPGDLASSKGPLSVWIEGRLVLQYARETQTVACRSFCYWNGCSTQSWVETTHDWAVFEYPKTSVPLSFSVVHPASRTVSFTPWIANYSMFLPAMTTYLYSNSSLYFLQSRWDGVPTGYRRFQSFGLGQDDAGAWSIYSVANASAGASVTQPSKFQASAARNFLYAYRADQALGSTAPLGVHSWTVTGWDFFGDAVDFRQNVSGHAAARLSVALSNESIPLALPVQASLTLTDASGSALIGLPLVLETPGQSYVLNTDGHGRATVWFTPRMAGANRLVARFDGTGGVLPAFADAVVYVTSGSAASGDVVRRYDGLLLLFVLVLGFCLVRFR